VEESGRVATGDELAMPLCAEDWEITAAAAGAAASLEAAPEVASGDAVSTDGATAMWIDGPSGAPATAGVVIEAPLPLEVSAPPVGPTIGAGPLPLSPGSVPVTLVEPAAGGAVLVTGVVLPAPEPTGATLWLVVSSDCEVPVGPALTGVVAS
jgi:hypothetical protein